MTRATNQQITTACDKHGAATVYDACNRAFGGDKTRFLAMGFDAPANLGDIYAVHTGAFALMSPSDRADDLADLTIAEAKRK